MTTRVELYGALRERAGTGEIDLDLAPGATIDDVVAAVRARFPALGGRMIAAAGLDHVDATHIVQPGEIISLLPAEE